MAENKRPRAPYDLKVHVLADDMKQAAAFASSEEFAICRERVTAAMERFRTGTKVASVLDAEELETLRSALLIAAERYESNARLCEEMAREKPGLESATPMRAQFLAQAERARQLYVQIADAANVVIEPDHG